jgi:hypothetical protein
MSRASLEDRICYCRRELADLEAMQTNCSTCERKKYNSSECMKHGYIPAEFAVRTDCPDWEFNLLPF